MMRPPLGWMLISAAAMLLPHDALAGPEGGSVVAGNATITHGTRRTDVTQASARAVIDWHSYSIGTGEVVQYHQPDASAVVLNRVTGSQMSQIDGSLLANGRVFLVNPNGVVVGASGKVDVGSFLATTASISTADFMAGTERFRDAPDGVAVTNAGTITAAEGGSVILSAARVENAGVIVARKGSVALGAAEGFRIDVDGDGLLLYEIGEATAQALVSNPGAVVADAGRVRFSARSRDAVVRDVINTTGLVEANSVSLENGEIIFDGGTSGRVALGGIIRAVGDDAGERGGAIYATGAAVTATADARIDASGDAGGGRIALGTWDTNATTLATAATVDASATGNGDGGKILVFGKTTRAAANLRARGGIEAGDGGFVETSGGTVDLTGIAVDVGASEGTGGGWLLDPADLMVDAALAASVNAALTGGSVTLQTTAGGVACTGVSCASGSAAGNGDIIIASALAWSANTLTLNAYRNVQINSDVSVGGTGTFAMTTETGGYDLTGSGASVTLSGGAALAINGHAYTVISDAAGLQGVGTSGYYALANDIDLSGIPNFVPITGFASGSHLDGLGHSISNLAISGGSDLGLFAAASGTLRNFSIANATILATGNNVGTIAGQLIGGSIVNAAASGTITSGGGGNEKLGGLVGYGSAGTIHAASSAVDITIGDNVTNVAGVVGYMTGGSVSDTSSSGNVTGGGQAYAIGGLIGQLYGNVSNSSASGAVSLGDNADSVGGLVGVQAGGAITGSHATGTVLVGNNAGQGGYGVGGFIGTLYEGSVSSSYASGAVSAQDYAQFIGGFVGFSNVSTVISRSSASGAVTVGDNASGVGGFAALVGGTIQDSHASGAVSAGDNAANVGGFAATIQGALQSVYGIGSVTTGSGAYGNVGGLVGNNAGTVTSSYWNVETSGQTTSGGGTGLTTAGFSQPDSFSGWDFDTVWVITSDGVPKLRVFGNLPAPAVLSPPRLPDAALSETLVPTSQAANGGSFGGIDAGLPATGGGNPPGGATSQAQDTFDRTTQILDDAPATLPQSDEGSSAQVPIPATSSAPPPQGDEPAPKPEVVAVIPGLLSQVVSVSADEQDEEEEGVAGTGARFSVMGNHAQW